MMVAVHHNLDVQMQDMNPADIKREYQESLLDYHDGSKRTVLVTEMEIPFPDGRLIVSRTDPAGLITQVAQSFVEMSGFSEEELIGQPHHILRHPDMPPAAFKDLWDTVQAGNCWQSYVKNLRSAGVVVDG